MNASVTNLDLFRVWRENEDLDIGWLISRLRGEEETEQMRAGSALHKALEAITEGETNYLTANGYRFEFVKDCEIQLVPCRELSISKEYGGLTVRGRVDCISGLVVSDYKTTSQFDADRLMSGFPWRFYLDMMDAEIFRWLVFVMRETDQPKVYSIVDFHSLEQRAYPDMRTDCSDLARDYLAFAREHADALRAPRPTLLQQLEKSLELVTKE